MMKNSYIDSIKRFLKLGLLPISKYTPTETIEKEKNPKLEQAYLKLPGQGLITVGYNRTTNQVLTDNSRALRIAKAFRRKDYTHIHTHPNGHLTPSSVDLKSFLSNNTEKTMIVADTDDKSGKLRSYFILRKTKNTPKYLGDEYSDKINDAVKEYRAARSHGDLNDVGEALKTLAKDFNLNYRTVLSEGYSLSDEASFLKSSRLERIAAGFFGLILLMGGLLFARGITGGVVFNFNPQTIPSIGAGMIIFGVLILIWSFKPEKRLKIVYVKNKKKKKELKRNNNNL
jgi:hypothetical protein